MSGTVCEKCGGWTHNADGHRDDCPTKSPEMDSDARMLLVWEAWAKKEGNDGAAELFRRCATRLRALASSSSAIREAATQAHQLVNHMIYVADKNGDADGRAHVGILSEVETALRAALSSSGASPTDTNGQQEQNQG